MRKILPNHNVEERKRVLVKENYYSNSKKRIPPKIHWGFLQLLSRIAHCFRKCETHRQIVIESDDFSYEAAFEFIDYEDNRHLKYYEFLFFLM